MHKQIDTSGHDFSIHHVGHDINGNARYVVHFLTIPYQDDDSQPFYINQANHIEAARKALYGKKYRAKLFGGKKYRAKLFGGGIVFQAYAGDPVKHVLNAIGRASA